MKKILKITGVLILTVLLILIISPIIFKPKLINMVNTELSNTLDAKVEFENLKLSFIKNFPNVFVGIYNMSITGVDDFKGDTLIAFEAIKLSLDMSSLFGDQIQVNSVIVDKPLVNAIVLKSGKANWDIYTSSEDSAVVVDTVETESTFKLGLKQFLINNARISYIDEEMNIETHLVDLNYSLRGDFTQDFTHLINALSVHQLSYTMDDITYLNKVKVIYDAGIDADLQMFKFTFADNLFQINNIKLSFEGFVELPDSLINMDMRFNLNETGFKDLLSMIPVVYKTDFEGLETKGKFLFNGYAKGIYSETSLPDFKLNFIVENAMFKYPELPDAVENVNVNMQVSNPGGPEDLTKIDINKFQLRIADNPISMIMHLSTPISDPEINAAIKAKFDFASITKVIPLEDMEIGGMVNTNIELGGKLSTLEQEKYEDFKANGSFSLANFMFSMDSLPYNITIPAAILEFTPQYAQLNKLNMKIGQSDFNFRGKLSNYIAYALNDDVLNGELFYHSAFINVDEFMTDSLETEQVNDAEVQDTVPMAPFEIPSNINFKLITSIDKIDYDNIEISQVAGSLIVADAKARLENFKMYMLNGFLAMNGYYDAADINKPAIDLAMEISGFDIATTYSKINTVKELAPAAQNMQGKFSTSLTFNSLLNSNLEPIYSTIISDGRLITQNVEIKGSMIFNKIAEAIKYKQMNDLVVKNVDLKYHIENGEIEIEPFEVNIGNMKAEISGNQKFDKTLNYNMLLNIPMRDISSQTNTLLSGLNGSGTSGQNYIPISALVTGVFNNPQVKLQKGGGNIKDAASEIIDNKKKEIKDNAKKVAREKAAKIIADADKKAKAILAEADKSANKIRAEAKIAGDKLVSEADKKGKELVKKAGNNIIKKKLAQETAKKMLEEANKKAVTLNNEADNTSNKILLEAQDKADKIRADAKKKADNL